MNFFKRLFKTRPVEISIKIEHSGAVLQEDFSESRLDVNQLKGIASEFAVKSYDQNQVLINCQEIMQLINLARYAETPQNVVDNFKKTKVNFKLLSVYKSLNPYQFRLDAQTAHDRFEYNLPKNRIGKREINYIVNADDFLNDYEFNIQCCIHNELQRVFEVLKCETEISLKKERSKAWVSYYKDHATALENVTTGDEEVIYNAKEWLNQIKGWQKIK
jgi:hypothetical protein